MFKFLRILKCQGIGQNQYYGLVTVKGLAWWWYYLIINLNVYQEHFYCCMLLKM